MRSLLLFLFLSTAGLAAQPSPEAWGLFATVQFKPKFLEAYDEYFLFPEFSPVVKAREGKVIEISGHYLPMDLSDKQVVIISKFPFAACFFCGGAGPESVAEIHLTTKPPRLKADQMITVRGTLQLNDSDVNHMNFLLKDATIIKL